MSWIEVTDGDDNISWLSVNHIIRVTYKLRATYLVIRASDGETYFRKVEGKDVHSIRSEVKTMLNGDWDTSE